MGASRAGHSCGRRRVLSVVDVPVVVVVVEVELVEVTVRLW